MSAGADRRITREAQERKDQSLVQAQRLESLGQLAGGVAHDFNNLLAVILNYLSFASEEVDAAAGPDPSPHLAAAGADLAEVKKARERAAGLPISCSCSRGATWSGRRSSTLTALSPRLRSMLRRTLGEHVELVIALAGDLWPVLADPGQLEQVLVNLAVNARDAMPDGGTLTIDTGNITVDADMIAGGIEGAAGTQCAAAGQRHRRRNDGRDRRARVRAVLHDQAGRRRDGTGAGHRLRDSHAGRRGHPDLFRARSGHDVHHHPAGHRGGGRAYRRSPLPTSGPQGGNSPRGRGRGRRCAR